MKRTTSVPLAVLGGLTLLAGCGSGASDDADAGEGKTVTLVTHNSFEVSDEVLERFTEETGYEVEILRTGDGGVLVNQAVLTAGNPQGDVLFGVDNTLLSRALDEDVFAPYQAADLARVDPTLQLDEGEWRVTPVDTGDICVNYDRAWFADEGLAPPETLDDLVDPDYADLLVVQNAATSTPGLGFLLATVGAYGEDGWQEYWDQLDANGVEVVDGWEQAYNERFSGSAGDGDRPLVVSYASSPPAEVHYSEEALPDEAPTGVAPGTCFRQIEFAGLLAGAENPEGGEELLDFLISEEFQEDVPLQMFVHPVRDDVELPEVFTRYGEEIDEPHVVEPGAITEHREEWVEEWTARVLR